MELNAEQIKKALECCLTPKCSNCMECPARQSLTGTDCLGFVIGQTLSLIKELTEENENLHASCTELTRKCASLTEENERLEAEITHLEGHREADVKAFKTLKADTVRKTQSAIIEYYSKPKYQPTKERPIKHTQIEHLFAVLDQIAKEIANE